MKQGRVIAGLAVAASLVAAAPAAAANILPTGYWSLNETSGVTAHDDALRGDPGTLQAGASWAQGRFRGGASFDGNASSVLVKDSKWLEPDKLTVSAWVEADSAPGSYKYIVGKGANECLTGSWGLYTGENGGVQFYAGTSQVSYVMSPAASSGIWNGKWHNVIGTFDGSTVRMYVDGKQVGSGTPDTTPLTYGMPSSNDLMIGNYPGCSGQNLTFTGKVDEVKLFDRALGSQEISLGYLASRLMPQSSPIDLIL